MGIGKTDPENQWSLVPGLALFTGLERFRFKCCDLEIIRGGIFLKKHATCRLRFCKEQNRNRCNFNQPVVYFSQLKERHVDSNQICPPEQRPPRPAAMESP
jgi:hypothetical protein